MEVASSVTFPSFSYHPSEVSTPEEIKKFVEDLPISEDLFLKEFTPAEFEKDDDLNHHIDFIASCANLRAEK